MASMGAQMGWGGRAAQDLVKVAGGAKGWWSYGRRLRKRRRTVERAMALIPC
jgi:hypothetical protein